MKGLKGALWLLLLVGCGSTVVDLGGDPRRTDVAGTERDGGSQLSDAGPGLDAGPRDAAALDRDAGTGEPDAAPYDAAIVLEAGAPDGAVEVDAGLSVDAGVLADGGSDAGLDENSSGTQVTGVVTRLRVGENASCAALSGGRVACWGRNDYGQLGQPARVSQGCVGCEPSPAVVDVLRNASDIAVGATHTCAIRGGKVLCMGSNLFGELGNGASDLDAHPEPVEVALPGVVALALGRGHSCALNSVGKVFCWGLALHGEVGTDPKNAQTCTVSADRLAALGMPLRTTQVPCAKTPREVTGLGVAQKLSSGTFHICSIESDATLRCWGDNASGQIGNGSQSSWALPAIVGSSISSVDPGFQHTCSLSGSSTFCWGQNTFGQLGVGPLSSDNLIRRFPSLAASAGAGVSVATGEAHSCLVDTSSSVRCAGANESGQLAAAATSTCSSGGVETPCAPTFVAAALSGSVKAVAAGLAHTCALVQSAVYCWGGNTFGQLGTGTSSAPEAPARVLGP